VWKQQGQTGREESEVCLSMFCSFTIMSQLFICEMRLTGRLLGGLVRIQSRTQIAIVHEVTACQMSSKKCMNIPSYFKVKCGSLTRARYTWEMECILHTHTRIRTHTELMTVT